MLAQPFPRLQRLVSRQQRAFERGELSWVQGTKRRRAQLAPLRRSSAARKTRV